MRTYDNELSFYLLEGGDPVKKKFKKALPVILVLVLALALAVPAFAQDPTPTTATLALDSTELTNGLFTGANIMIAALGSILFILAGFKLGGGILRSIVDAVSGRLF